MMLNSYVNQSLRFRLKSILPAIGLVMIGTAGYADTLRLPVECTLGEDCFVQQYPDMDPGTGAKDPFCGAATYDGHSGIDIRVLSMRDIERDVPVVAAAAGRVKGVRDGEADRLVTNQKLVEAVKNKECGNGVTLEHADKLETLYCHMKNGSIVVKVGDQVEAGQKLGSIGASGLAAFPHVHLAARKDGMTVDPVSGRALDSGCVDDETKTPESETKSAGGLFDKDVTASMTGESAILSIGVTDQPVDYDSLVTDGPPDAPAPGGGATVGWAWVANIREGDHIRFDLKRPDGTAVIASTTPPHPKNQAVAMRFAGTDESLVAGDYLIHVAIIRDGQEITATEETVSIGP